MVMMGENVCLCSERAWQECQNHVQCLQKAEPGCCFPKRSRCPVLSDLGGIWETHREVWGVEPWSGARDNIRAVLPSTKLDSVVFHIFPLLLLQYPKYKGSGDNIFFKMLQNFLQTIFWEIGNHLCCSQKVGVYSWVEILVPKKIGDKNIKAKWVSGERSS